MLRMCYRINVAEKKDGNEKMFTALATLTTHPLRWWSTASSQFQLRRLETGFLDCSHIS
jgi:hypothetical protein